MTSSSEREAFVWIWLPNATEPVVAGRLEADNGNVRFNYGKSYLERIGDSNPAISIYEPDELTYLLESGSDRIGALDFQRSPTEYVPRTAKNPSIEELMESSDRVEKGIILTPEPDQELFHGSSVGGARPKALIQDRDRKYIAKFSSSADLYSVVKAEFIAMRLAALAGLNVAPVQLTKTVGKDVASVWDVVSYNVHGSIR